MALLVALWLSVPAPAQGFGTINSLGQRAEHERITRAALACPAGVPSTGDCFEPRSIDQLAGQTGTFGAVGAPDSDEVFDPSAHCDDADFLDVPGYPRTRAQATAALLDCVSHLRVRFDEGIEAAADLLDSNGDVLESEVDLSFDCTFFLGIPGRAKCNAIEGFGRMLHGVQDFYSHSNWADESDPSRPISISNPPGLDRTGPTPIFDFLTTSVPTIPQDLTTGFFDGIFGDDCPGTTRITHACLNKDKALIDPVTGAVSDPQTERGQVLDNAAKAVAAAIAETRQQWEDFQVTLIARYGAVDANKIILALTQDDPLASQPGVVEPQIIFPGQYRASGTEDHTFHIENAGSAPAFVQADWYNLQGSKVGAGTVLSSALAPGAALDYGAQGSVPEGFRGTLVISSDQPLAGNDTVYRTIGGVVSVGGRTGLNPMPGSTGSVVSLPYVSNQLNQTYNTTIHIANAGTSTACVQVQYSFVPGQGAVPAGGRAPVVDSGPGGSGCAFGFPLAPNGSMTISPVSGAGLTPYPASTANTLMAATVTATGSGVVAIVDASLSTGLRKAASYEGFLVSSIPSTPGDLGTDIAIPVALTTSDGYYSQILMSNPNSFPATVTIEYRSGGSTYPVTLTIPAGGVTNHSVYSDGVVPVGFIGAAQISSNLPIAAVLFRSKMTTAFSYIDEDLYTAVNGSLTSKASTTLFLPTVSRRLLKDASHDGMNTWLSVTVPGGGQALVTIQTESREWPGVAGCPAQGSFSITKLVTGSFVFYQNADFENGFGANPVCLLGSMTITSDVPILAVASFITDVIQGDQEANFQVPVLR